jgi:hypothetical protein
MNKMGQIFAANGPFVSTQYWSDQDCQDTEVFFHHSQKAECMLTACSSWYGGDFFEFGSHDLNTFRDFLSSYNVCGMTRSYQDVQFWGFDIFGKLEKDVGEHTKYFEPYSSQGDRLAHHQQLIDSHGIHVEKCHLVQGLFENTLTQELREKWRNDKAAGVDYSETALHLPPEHRNHKQRQIGFASLDCNIPSSYKTVFEWIFDVMAPNSYIYMDEGLQSPEVLAMWGNFRAALRLKRNLGTAYVRNAAGFGALHRLYPIVEAPLNI